MTLTRDPFFLVFSGGLTKSELDRIPAPKEETDLTVNAAGDFLVIDASGTYLRTN